MYAKRFLPLLFGTIAQVQSFIITKPSFAPLSITTAKPSVATALHLNIPRITLPEPVAEALESIDLKNPNELDTEEYNSYSGAAIAGTLIFFLLPGALVSGVYDVIGEFLAAAGKDFAFSALIGGGLAAYLSLRKDGAGEAANNLGKTALNAVDKLLE
mmetsp:Transcript_62597/g.75334  ORF Transcript_62597/g.75334 Transcript_62597/m.75334 type:complete len:158 (+) Transcript_62597:85-558(+)